MTQYSKKWQYQQIAKAKVLIDTNYMDKLTIDILAHEANFSKFHFVRLFKNIYGITPLQYLTNVRIKAAKDFIKSGVTLTEASWKVGFDSVSSFMALFKEKTDCNSSTYRKERQRYKEQLQENPTQVIPSCLLFPNNLK